LSIDPTLGGNDTITGGAGHSLMIGGVGNDTITGGNGGNIVIGGDGKASFSYGWVFNSISSFSSNLAGTDSVNAGGGTNIVLTGPSNRTVSNAQLPVWQFAAASAPADQSDVTPLSNADLQATVTVARQIWAQTLGAGDARLAALSTISVETADLPGNALGATIGDVIVIDATAAGWGWYVGSADNSAFTTRLSDTVLIAAAGSPAAGRMDLLTTVLHEMGNAMGFAEDNGRDITGHVLQAGERRLPPANAASLPLAGTAAPSVPKVNWDIKRNDHADRLTPDTDPETPSWVNDFVNHLGNDHSRRLPNAALRVRMPLPEILTGD
jgi:microcystin-dependent protein